MRILTVEDMRRVEAAADEGGHSYAGMMERAGRGVAEALLARRDVQGKRVLVLVGPGNNGGDGLVAARYLAQAGAEAACYLLRPRDEGDANFQAAREHEISISDAGADQDWQTLRQLVAGADVIVDALLGTGVRLPLRGTVGELLEQVHESLRARRARQLSARALNAPARPSAPLPAPLVVAVDGPSGLDYVSGELDPLALAANVSVTFAFPKPGHFLLPGAAACGELVVADIGISPGLTQELLGPAQLQVATSEWVGALLPPRPAGAHKGTFGKALLVAGSINYTGAAHLAASGAARVGAGLITLAVPAALHGALAARSSQATFLLLPQALGVVAPEAVSLLLERAKDYQAMLLGPGLTQEKEAVEFVQQLFQAEGPGKRKVIGFQADRSAPAGQEQPALPPLVVDADGLNALAALEGEEWWQRLPPTSVLTPHPGEMARLMGVQTGEVQANRLAAARDMAARWGHVVVLKGAYTLVAHPGGQTVILPFATPALATAGSGDVLAGAIVGLLAQGLRPFDAALAGAYLHGLAGSWAAEEIGQAGVIASDLLPRLPRAVHELTTNHQPPTTNHQ
jgi:NAD(P)H-hydrate epimerase